MNVYSLTLGGSSPPCVKGGVTGSSFHKCCYEEQEKRKQKFLRWGAVASLNLITNKQ
jgi:hypothetical protein